MADLTDTQKQRIFEAFLAMDPYAYGRGDMSTGAYYKGYVTLEGLIHVADVIAQMQQESAAALPACPYCSTYEGT